MQHKIIQDQFLYTVFDYVTTLFEKCKWHIFRSAFILHAELNMICKQDRQRTNKHNMETRSRNHSCQESNNITYSECDSVDFVA
jgi:hypothetical protein